MSFSACPLEEYGADRWDALVDQYDEAWLWHRSDYRESIDYWFEQTSQSFVVLDDGRQPVAIVPLRLSRMRLLHAVPVKVLRSVGGPACADGLGPKQRARVVDFIRSCLADLARRLGVVEIEISAPPMAPALRGARCPRTNPLAWFGCQNTASQTWVVDLRRPEEDIRKAYAAGTREELKKIRREPCEIQAGSGAAGAESFHALIQATFARRGQVPHPPAYIRHVFEHFVDRGLARALFFVRDGEILAGNIAAVYKGGGLYWFGATRHDRFVGVNRALLDRQIIDARAAGAEFFETGQASLAGGDPALRGISDFKRSFGAELYPLFSGLIVTKPTLHAALALARALRRS